jgi:DHA1 family inner membrane transport protein
MENTTGARPEASKHSAFPIPILALTVCAFCIGTAEFVVMGLLPDISRDLAVSIPLAGQLVTAYALGVVIGAPLLAIATSRMPRKRLLLLSVGIFVLGNLLSAISPNYVLLAGARVLAAFAHGTMFGVGAVVAAGLVPPSRRASAIALMFTGLTLANILGVPFGTFIGQLYGWRATFWAITALGALAFIPVALFVPNVAAGPTSGLRREFASLRRTDVLLAIATTVLGSASVFTVFTYIVPMLQEVSGFLPRTVTLILFMIGIGLTIGITLGGKLADRGPLRASAITILFLAVVSVAFSVASPAWMAALLVVFAWAIVSFTPVPALQTRVVDTAKEAPNLASTINIGAFNLGNAGGAFLGGMVIDAGLGLRAVPIAAALVALCGVAAAAAGMALDRRPTGRGQ